MRYIIVYDRPGRLRLRMGQGAFSVEQGYGIENLLLSNKWVQSAEANIISGGLLIYYAQGSRQRVLDIIDSLDSERLPSAQKRGRGGDRAKRLDGDFAFTVTKIILRRYILKLFFPAPIRMAVTVRRALFYWKAGIEALKEGKVNLDVLDASVIAVSIARRDYNTAGSVMTLFHIIQVMDEYNRKKAEQTLAKNFALNIDSVWRACPESNGLDILTPISRIAVGDIVRVRTGGVIPLDGEITGGEAMINEASMTGEPLSRVRRPGHSVYAGTVVEEGSILIKVRTLAENTRIQNIITMIDESEALKAAVQSKAEKLADTIVPFNFLATAVTFFLTGSIAKAASVLMVDYSCAIRLTTSICVISGMHQSVNNRILVKGGIYLESYAKADTIVFDKTGTLTTSCPHVAKVVPFGSYTREYVLKIAACLEEHFPHSVAKAIVRQSEEEKLEHEEEHTDVEYVVAHGIASTLHNQRVIIGSEHFVFEDEGVPLSKADEAVMKSECSGHSVVYLAIGGKLAGMICINDPVRTEARSVLEKLKTLGLRKIVMLTGDGHAAAKNACDALGIKEYYAKMLPEDKAEIIRKYKEQGHIVIMVGDGVNDSPALSCADASVAMKDGSDIAREISDITLLSENLDGLVELRVISRGIFERINKNYWFILVYNTALILLGAGGVFSAPTSALLHNFSTLGLSGMSMRNYKTGSRKPSK